MERYGVCVCVNIHKEAILSKVQNAPPLQDACVCVCVCVCWEKGNEEKRWALEMGGIWGPERLGNRPSGPQLARE